MNTTPSLGELINKAIAFRQLLDDYFEYCILSAGEKSSLSRKANDIIRQLEKIRLSQTQSN